RRFRHDWRHVVFHASGGKARAGGARAAHRRAAPALMAQAMFLRAWTRHMRVLGASVLGASLAIGAPALAQSADAPQGSAQSAGQSMGQSGPPAPDAQPQTPPDDFLPSAPKPSGIETQQLNQLDVWSVSALSRGQGALDPALWSGTDPAALALLFDRLPASYESPAAEALMRRVLLSGGPAPQEPTPGDAQAAARKRFEALGKVGFADELAVMAAGAGPGLSDPVIAQYAAQAELARGRVPEACARGRQAQADPPPPFILR